MNELFKSFDTYSLKARVFPALIAGLPTLALLLVIVPWDDFRLSQVTATAMGLVLLFAFADVARRQGKRVERKLGTGATPELWHRRDATLAGSIKDRYRAYVAKQIRLAEPTEDEEKLSPQRADDFYITAGAWIRENTRDQRRFGILFAENVTYGFRRNLLGLKPISLAFNALVLAASLAMLRFRPAYLTNINDIDEKLTVVTIAVVLHSAYMLLAVGAKSLREASITYGRQLILSCETLMQSSPVATRAPSKGRGNANS